jgi:bacterioferritin
MLAKRIVQLGGEPNFAPDELTNHSNAEYEECESLGGMIKANVVAERIAIASYRECIRYLSFDDPTTTSHMLKTILAVEEEHADELADLMVSMRN